MPRLSVWFIRTSLVYLVLGFSFGGLMLINKGLPLHFLLWRLLPSHIEFVLFGWAVLLVMGMGFWILPRFSSHPVRGNETLAWAAFILVNIGIILIVLASLGAGGVWFTLAGRAAEAAGVLLFVAHAWPRIGGFGTPRQQK
jgi:cbb3-type cytochrome oxidase subunit 1